VHYLRCKKSPVRFSSIGLAALGMLVLGIASCSSPRNPGQGEAPDLGESWPKPNQAFTQAAYRPLRVALPEIAGAELVGDDELCESCHETYLKSFADNVHGMHSDATCESCHGPASRHLETRGKEPGLIYSFKTMNSCEKSEVCLQCHEENACSPGAQWRTSVHAHKGVSCTDCHRGHYNVPYGTPATSEPGETTGSQWGSDPLALIRGQNPVTEVSYNVESNNLGASAPGTCYQCHAEKRDLQTIAGPHQIGGQNGFNCTTCHDPHGKIKEGTRKDLCLECHGQGGPTMAWHSSTHDLEGVACTDCHNPHPSANVPQVVNISHTAVRRPNRMPMSVDEPGTCYKCHPKVFGLNALPSHHPIKEGKMTCSDCHDAHGQQEGNLKADRINDLCYKCHAEKQGPFVYEHAPVTEDCGICHEPHGTVANNLLRQPPVFLCLRCHTGHRAHHGELDPDGDVDNQIAFYTDCTQCHTQIHGSDQPSPFTRKTDLMR